METDQREAPARNRMHLVVRAAGMTAPDVDAETKRRAVLALAGIYAEDAADLAELLAALGLTAADARPTSNVSVRPSGSPGAR